MNNFHDTISNCKKVAIFEQRNELKLVNKTKSIRRIV